jgi:hypothetical protein
MRPREMLVMAIWTKIRQTLMSGGRKAPSSPALQLAHGAAYMPTKTPTRPDASSWDPQDLTSERDTELDTITGDRQVEIRRIASELVEAPRSAAPRPS